MLNKQTLDVIYAALTAVKDAGLTVSGDEPEKEMLDRAIGDIQTLRDGDAIASIWTIDDVYAIMFKDAEDVDEEVNREHTEDEIAIAREVLKRCEQYHDAEIGINWDVINEHYQMVMDEGKQ